MTTTCKKLVVLISGNGSNLQAIINATTTGLIPNTKIVNVISNNRSALGIERARVADIPCEIIEVQKGETRTQYDARLVKHIKKYECDLIVLAGWMRIVTSIFINAFNVGRIINLHPALPGQFAGSDGIGDALASYRRGLITHTGLMVHEVIEELDAGLTLETEVVEIFPNDTIETLTERVQGREKLALLNAIYKKLYHQIPSLGHNIYEGKVRDMHDIGYGLMAMEHSDRLSAFDRSICNIPGKGKLLLNTSKWWFDQTKAIIDNHYIWHDSNVMIVRKCVPIPLEIVVRGYITGATSTSLWTHYSAGEREYCGHVIRDGYIKNQKLDSIIITPTSKSASDQLLCESEIISKKIVTQEEWNTISKIALQLFSFGQYHASQCGLILADTKYEFGWYNGKLMLIDEIHTPDSSRFWFKGSYESRISQGLEPQKIDKDVIRDYLKSLPWNPYDDPDKSNRNVPKIPENIKKDVIDAYTSVYNKLVHRYDDTIETPEFLSEINNPFDVILERYWNEIHSPVLFIVGKSRDLVSPTIAEAKKEGIYTRVIETDFFGSPGVLMDYIKKINKKSSGKYVWLCVGGADADTSPLGLTLSTFIARNAKHPTILHSTCEYDYKYLSGLEFPILIVKNTSTAVAAVKKLLNLE
jgi:formyltetrahydrofolate-dependent phosphoribosylglycinamide formyltransferase